MNERIAKLYNQAIIIEDGGDYVCGELDPEKFAELIVEEMYVFMCNATDNDKPWPTFKEVKQHFGVEE
jgi:hypothetical protein